MRDPREPRLVRVGDLTIDPTRQRDITKAGFAKIDEMAENWDWGAVGGIVVTELDDGKLVVNIGQHRTLALQKQDPDAEVWVFVMPFKTLQEEAKAAIVEAEVRTGHPPAEKWKLALTAGSDREVWATNWLTNRGLSIGAGPATFNHIDAVAAVREILYGKGKMHRDFQVSKVIFSTTIGIIRGLWPTDDGTADQRFHTFILKAYAKVAERNMGEIEYARIFERLNWPVDTYIAEAKKAPRGADPSLYLAEQIVAGYNKHLKAKGGRKLSL